MEAQSSLADVLFIRLQASILCRSIVHEDGKTVLVDWLYGIERMDTEPFYIVHEWCGSVGQALVCFEEIQFVDSDGNIEANLRMSPFQFGGRFWNIVRNYWEVAEFRPNKTGTHEIRTTLYELDSDRVLYKQTDPLHIL